MTVREAMNIINGALDSLYEFYSDTDEAESVFEEIGLAEEVLEKFIEKKDRTFENYYAHCPDCGIRLEYDSFEHDVEISNTVVFKAKGHCPNCQETYIWTETFELAEIEFDD